MAEITPRERVRKTLMKRFGHDCVGIYPGPPYKSIETDLPDGTWQDAFGVNRRKPKDIEESLALCWLPFYL